VGITALHANVESRLRFETLLADLSTRFINLPAEEMDREIEDGQRRVCEALRFDMSAFWQWTDSHPRIFTITHLYRPGGGPPAPERPDAQNLFPWSLQQLMDGRTVPFLMEDPPPAAVVDQASYLRFGIRSSLTIPLSAGGGALMGALSFNARRAVQAWPSTLVDRLRLVAQIFANALARKSSDMRLRESEAALRRSREQFALAMEGSDDGLWDWEIATNRVYYSPRWKEMLGYADDELPNAFATWEDRLHPEDQERALAAMKSYLAAPRSTFELECRLRHKDGRYRWILTRGRASCDAQGRPIRMTGSNRDITGRKQVEAQLRKSQAQLASAVDLAELALYEEGQGERFTVQDNRIHDLLGLVPGQQEGIRAHWVNHIHPDDRDRMVDISGRVRTGGLDRIASEYRYLHPRRGPIWITHLVHVLERDSDGRVVRTVGVLQDITPRKQAEIDTLRLRQDLSHASRVTTLGEMVSAFAHEIKQPLGAILSNAEAADLLLRADPPDLAQTLEILADIRRDDERAGEIIQRIRGFLRKRDAERVPLDANDLVRDVVRLVQNDAALREVALQTELAPDLPRLRGDRVQLQQVLVNLVINAMDAMAEVPVGKRNLVLQTARTGTGGAEVAVADSGTGIPADRLPRLFEPFYSTKPNGLGMGLPISRTIVEAHNGRIATENNPGGGATFRILFPPDGGTPP
jgi:hypothetical protein